MSRKFRAITQIFLIPLGPWKFQAGTQKSRFCASEFCACKSCPGPGVYIIMGSSWFCWICLIQILSALDLWQDCGHSLYLCFCNFANLPHIGDVDCRLAHNQFDFWLLFFFSYFTAAVHVEMWEGLCWNLVFVRKSLYLNLMGDIKNGNFGIINMKVRYITLDYYFLFCCAVISLRDRDASILTMIILLSSAGINVWRGS